MCTIIPADYFGLQRYELSTKSPNYIDYKNLFQGGILQNIHFVNKY